MMRVILEQMKQALRALSAMKKVFYEDDLSIVIEWENFINTILERLQWSLFIIYLRITTDELPIVGNIYRKPIPLLFLTDMVVLQTKSFPTWTS